MAEDFIHMSKEECFFIVLLMGSFNVLLMGLSRKKKKASETA